jgi:methionyl-tRNA formyltransferase
VRVAFAGSPPAAVPPLRALAASPHDVALVVTQPDRSRGRSGRPAPTAVAVAAGELGIPVIRPESINRPEAIEQLEGAGIEALAVAAFGQILRDGILSRWPCINVHFSLLPAYRGAAPVERALMDGVEETGVTIMRMDAGLDTGPVLAKLAVPVEPGEDAGSLTARLAEAGGPLLVRVLDELAAGTLQPADQPAEGVSLAPKIGPEDRPLDPARPAVELERRVRALSPHIGATCTIDGAPFKVWSARALDKDAPAPLTVDGDRLLMACAGGSLEILELQPPGRARMAAADFLRGWRGPLELGPAGA